MAGISQGDIFIKLAIELGLEDIRKNPWLIDHILSDLVTNKYANQKYGQSQVDAAKEWILNNQVDIYLAPRSDKDRMPFISINVESSKEKNEMKHMGDSSTEDVILMPNQIGKPINYIVAPFTPLGYDPDIGLISVDPNLKGMDAVNAGQILVDPSNGQGFVIQDVTSDGLIIESGIQIDAAQLGIVPQFQYYTARVEHTFFEENYTISCHTHGDTQPLLWLHSIVLYSILRYRESLLEANGFSESYVQNSGIMEDPYHTGSDGEMAYVRSIALTTTTEQTWIKAPHRIIESTMIREKTSTGYNGGIKIIGNLDAPDFVDKTKEPWYTIKG